MTVRRATGAAYGSTLAIDEYYIEDYVPGLGLVPGSGNYVPGVGDDTAALQAVIDYLTSNNVANSTIRLPASLNLNSQPRTDRQGNAIVALPTHGGSGMVIWLRGAPGGTNITTTVTGQTYSASFGPPSVIGGPTAEQLGVNINFSRAQIYMTDVAVFVPANSTVCGIDLSRVPAIYLDRILVKSISPATQPTNVWSFGMRFPEGDNSGNLNIGAVEVQGMYAGVVMNSAHPAAHTIWLNQCVGGLCITGNEQYNGNDGHSAQISYLLTQECVNHLASWSPTSGIISIPASTPAQFTIGLWDIEDVTSGFWYATSLHILDANNQMFGSLNFARVVGSVGPVSGALTVSGAAKLARMDLTLPGPNPIQVGSAGAPAFQTAGWGNLGGAFAPVHFYVDANGLLHIGGSAKTTNGTATDGTTIFTLPTGYRPATAHFLGAGRSDTGATVAKIQVANDGTVSVSSSSALPAGTNVTIEDGAISLAI